MLPGYPTLVSRSNTWLISRYKLDANNGMKPLKYERGVFLLPLSYLNKNESLGRGNVRLNNIHVFLDQNIFQDTNAKFNYSIYLETSFFACTRPIVTLSGVQFCAQQVSAPSTEWRRGLPWKYPAKAPKRGAWCLRIVEHVLDFDVQNTVSKQLDLLIMVFHTHELSFLKVFICIIFNFGAERTR